MHLFEKYYALLPDKGEKPDLYLYPLNKPTLIQWHADRPIGISTLHCTTKHLTDLAGLEGQFSNHSLCVSNASRLYKAGCPEKLIKEVTGYRSDAVSIPPNSLKCAVNKTISKAPTEFKTPKVESKEKNVNLDKGQSLEDCIRSAGVQEMTEIMKQFDAQKVRKGQHDN